MTLSGVTKEFSSAWLPNISDSGLLRIIQLLESDSPFLIHGAFVSSPPMGCLASHVAWHHPCTEQYDYEAGVIWLTKVAKLNPATSLVMQAWDESQLENWNLRQELLKLCYQEYAQRHSDSPSNIDSRQSY